MTRGLAPLVLAAAPDPARYLCPSCRGRWDYDEVRHVLCCPECGGGLLRIEPER
jgi:Zn finger protein HypA/HybF involved in hydrogenase expression